MASIPKTSKDSSFPHAFKGLNEKELTDLYEAAKIENVNPGDLLFKEGDKDPSLRFILEGAVRIEKALNGRTSEIGVLHQWSSVDEIASKRKGRRTGSAVAIEPSSIMTLDEESLLTLSLGTKMSIYRNLNERTTQRLNYVIERERELYTKNKHLISYLRDYLEARNEHCVRSEIVQRILKGFPRLPIYTRKLAVRLLDEEVSATEVVDLAKLDPSLVGMVLKTVNSAYYNLQRKVSDFQQAVLLLGFSQVYQLVVSHGIQSIMPNTPEFQELQFHSILISLLSFEICRHCNLQKNTLHSTIGLLHDIGKSIILLLKQEYPKLEMIVDMLGHGKIGSLLLKEWEIPEVISLTLEYQHYPQFSPPTEIPVEHRENVAVQYLSHLCEGYLKGKSQEDLYTPFQDEYLRLLKISERSVGELVVRSILPTMTKKMKTFPEKVRQFLMESENRLLEKTSGDSEELPIVWNV
jgi:HD-like signal output (HDOD) protein